VNSSVRGPFAPAYCGQKWTDLFIDQLSADVGIVGVAISITPSQHSIAKMYHDKYGKLERNHQFLGHVQTTCYAVSQQVLGRLMKAGFYQANEALNKDETVRDYEIRLSQLILDMGLTNLNNRLVAQNSIALQENLANIAIAKLILFFVYLLALLICALFFNYDYHAIEILFLAAIIQFLNSFITYLRSNINANHLFKTDSFLGVADKLIMIIIFGTLFYSNSWKHLFTIHFFLYTQIFSYLMAIIFALFFTNKIITSPIRFSWQKFLPMIKQTIPYATLVLLMGLYMRSDMFLLERWLPDGAYQSGMYGKSFRLLDSLNMIGFLFAGILLPIFARQIASKESVLPVLQISAKLLIPASIAIAIFCGYYAQEILELLYHYSDATLINSFRLVIGVFPAMALMNIFSTLMASAAKIKEMIFITCIAAIISVLCNYFAIAYFN
jgi:O-antigen/teichoic acid export membrane protein